MVKVGDRLGPYELVALLGAGGMGEVYRAHDSRLGRQVAIKILSARLESAAAARDRFEREARAIAALSHPNIVALYDIGRHLGQSFVVMELVGGATLRGRLQSQPLPVKLAVDLASQIARALVAAHEKGIIHRDLKPDNIMVTPDGTAKVLDFGIAKMAVPEDAATMTMGATSPGLVLGTIGYCAPEQLRAEGADHRADIFSLGAILYEMLSGHAPYERATAADVIVATLQGTTSPLPAEVSPGLAAIIQRCLASAPEERFPSARELAGALRTADLTGTLAGTQPIPTGPTAGPVRRSIAVVPFADLSPNRDQEFFCDGIAEELMTALGRVPGLDLVSQSAVQQFKGQRVDAREVGRQLNVGTVLEGGVRRAGDRLRVTVQLADTRSGRQVWSDRLDGDVADIFALQDAIAQAVGGALHLTQATRHDDLRPAGNMAAYTAYLRGRHEWNRRTEDSIDRAVAFFREAVTLEPGYAQAHAGLADAYVTLGMYGALAPAATMEPARAAARAALAVAPDLPEPHAALACVHAAYEWDWKAAEQEFQTALGLDHAHARVHQWYAITHLVPQGRFGEAAREAQAAVAIEPLSPVVNLTAGLVPFFAGHLPQALQLLGRTVALDPGFAMAHFFLGQAHLAMGHTADALDEIQTAEGLTRGSPEILAASGCALAAAGHLDRSRAALGELRAMAGTRYVSPCLLAQVHLSLGETSAALAALAEAEAARAVELLWIGARPLFRPLYGEPAFLGLLDRAGLARPVAI